MTDDDVRWACDKKKNGWGLPAVAWPYRLWGIRHLRFYWHSYRTHRAASQWAAIGIGVGGPNPYDLWRLYAIFRGWA